MNTTAIDEARSEHLELFHANGFAFVDNPVTGRLQLSAVPFNGRPPLAWSKVCMSWYAPLSSPFSHEQRCSIAYTNLTFRRV
jgi:hypothetical protein